MGQSSKVWRTHSGCGNVDGLVQFSHRYDTVLVGLVAAGIVGFHTTNSTYYYDCLTEI